MSIITNIENLHKKISLEWIRWLLEEEKENQVGRNKTEKPNNNMKLLIRLYFSFVDQITWKKIINIKKNSFWELSHSLINIEIHHINNRNDTWGYYDCLP